MEKEFCHLHLHSEYSLLDSSAKITNIISKAKELGMKSIALTDHGVMYGCVAFYKEAVAQGIKPILGCEVYVAAKSKDIKINAVFAALSRFFIYESMLVGFPDGTNDSPTENSMHIPE